MYPKFHNTHDDYNLREVAKGLWVGAEKSPTLTPAGPWSLVVDLYGSPFEDGEGHRYKHTNTLLHWPFIDGEKFPDGLLYSVCACVKKARERGPVLIHCQAGLSRSASAAYAVLRVVYGVGEKDALKRIFVEPGWPRRTTLSSAGKFVDTIIPPSHS